MGTYMCMNKRERRQKRGGNRVQFSRVYYTNVLHGTTVISRDDSRASKVIRLIRYQRNEHTPRPSCSLKCKTFSYRYARSRDTFFSKQVPYQGRPREGQRRAGWEDLGGKGGWRRWRVAGIGQKSRESPHMKPLSPPIQQYFYIYYPLRR